MNGISIIITCYNCEDYIEECIKSIINLGIKNDYEIIVIDDNSNDNSYNQIVKYRNNHKVRIYRNKENMGAQFSRNLGLDIAKYKYVMVIDGDDKLKKRNNKKKETFIDEAINVLEDNQDIAFVQGIWEMFGNAKGYTITTYPLAEELIVNKHHVQTSIIHRKEDNAKYSNNIKKWQDWSFAIALLNNRLLKGKKNEIYFIEEPYYLYRMHSSKRRLSKREISEEEMILTTINENPEIFKKYYNFNNNAEIAKQIYCNIPTKLTLILYVANNNINIALKMIKEREYHFTKKMESKKFP